jgi:hypothetical protein
MELRDEDIDIQLWRYIDGQCTPDEQVHIQQLLATNTFWADAYNELLSFNTTVTNNIETEHPSMRFTQNIMDAIRAEEPVRKRYISNPFVKVFAGVFAALLLLLISYTVLNINWSSEQTSIHFVQKLKSFDRSKIVFITIAINTIVALVLVDTLLKRKRSSNS